ncbi:MAG: alpha/beta family hydrolase [bacterium]
MSGLEERPEIALPALVLAAGADVPLAAVAREIEAFGVTVLRADAPGRDGLREALVRARNGGHSAVWLGGHSEGAREAADLAASDAGCCDGLLLLSYPLRGPRHAVREPLPAISVPALFIQGAAGPPGVPDELRAAAQALPARTLVVTLEGAKYDLAGRRRAREIAEAFAEFAGLIPAEAVEIPITSVFDLHTIAPRDAEAALEAYLEEAHRRGLTALRIIHGRGIGVQREMVRRVLSRTPFVVRFSDAPAEAGGWGATVADLAERER